MDIDEGDVGIYLYELDVHGVGGTLDEALEDLAEAMLEYAGRLGRPVASRPNHRPARGYVRRIEIAGDTQGVVAMLNADADADADPDADAAPAPRARRIPTRDEAGAVRRRPHVLPRRRLGAQGRRGRTVGRQARGLDQVLRDGTLLRTVISKGRGTYKLSTTARILKHELRVTEAEFWAAVHKATPPRRPEARPRKTTRETLPLSVVRALLAAGYAADDMKTLTLAEAKRLLEQR